MQVSWFQFQHVLAVILLVLALHDARGIDLISDTDSPPWRRQRCHEPTWKQAPSKHMILNFI